MANAPFGLGFRDLPDVVALFPLAGVLLLPRGSLPLNVFEERYLAMTEDALKTDHRLIGMIQPTGGGDANTVAAATPPSDDSAARGAAAATPPSNDSAARGAAAATPPSDDSAARGAAAGRNGPELFAMGCAGRIVQFAETRDRRYMITLAGIARFNVVRELDMVRGYRRVQPDWSAFEADLEQEYERGLFDRERLIAALRRYFQAKKIDPNWKAIESMGDRMLVTSLGMGCPFNPFEKQALLEARELRARADVLTKLLEMSAAPDGSEGTRH